jgi:uncharacterized protein YxjI
MAALLSPIDLTLFPLFPTLIANESTTVIIEGNDSADVRTSSGKLLLKIKAEPTSGPHSKKIYDAQGNPIFNIRKESWNLDGDRYWLESPTDDSTKYFEMKTHLSTIGAYYDGTFTNAAAGKKESLYYNSNPVGKHGSIHLGDATGQVVANIEQQWTTSTKESYVTVAPGVDIGLIVGMVLCIDDRERGHTKQY